MVFVLGSYNVIEDIFRPKMEWIYIEYKPHWVYIDSLDLSAIFLTYTTPLIIIFWLIFPRKIINAVIFYVTISAYSYASDFFIEGVYNNKLEQNTEFFMFSINEQEIANQALRRWTSDHLPVPIEFKTFKAERVFRVDILNDIENCRNGIHSSCKFDDLAKSFFEYIYLVYSPLLMFIICFQGYLCNVSRKFSIYLEKRGDNSNATPI